MVQRLVAVLLLAVVTGSSQQGDSRTMRQRNVSDANQHFLHGLFLSARHSAAASAIRELSSAALTILLGRRGTRSVVPARRFVRYGNRIEMAWAKQSPRVQSLCSRPVIVGCARAMAPCEDRAAHHSQVHKRLLPGRPWHPARTTTSWSDGRKYIIAHHYLPHRFPLLCPPPPHLPPPPPSWHARFNSRSQPFSSLS